MISGNNEDKEVTTMSIQNTRKPLYSSYTRQRFHERTRKLFPGHAYGAYINKSDPAYYEKLLRVNRTHVRALYELGRQYEKQGFLRKAADYYERAVQADPCFEPAVGARILLTRRRKREEKKSTLSHVHILPPTPKRKRLTLMQMVGAVLFGYTMLTILIFGLLLR